MSRPTSPLLGLVAIVAIFSTIFLFGNADYWPHLDPWKFFVSVGSFSLIVLFGDRMLITGPDARPTQFANRFLMVTGAKLLFSVVLLLIILWVSDGVQRKVYSVVFVILYVTFTVFFSRTAIARNGRAKG